jgi:hypothetical protein
VVRVLTHGGAVAPNQALHSDRAATLVSRGIKLLHAARRVNYFVRPPEVARVRETLRWG